MSEPYRKGTVWYKSWTCAPGCPVHPAGHARHCASLRTGDRKAAWRLHVEHEQQLAEARARAVLGLTTTPRTPALSLARFRDHYLDHHQRAKKKSPETVALEGYVLKDLLTYAPEATLGDLTPDVVRRYEESARARYAPTTWYGRVGHLKTIFQAAVLWKLLAENPFRGLRKTKPPGHLPRAVPLETIPLLLEATTDPLLWLIQVFLYATGCRVSEMLRLERGHVFRQGGPQAASPHLIFWQTKAQRPRIISLTQALIQVLDAAEALAPGPFVFSRTGVRLDRRAVETAFQRLGRGLGLPYTPHMLRHSHATHTQRFGGSLKAVQAILGHADYQTTANIYTTVDLDMQRESMERLQIDRLLPLLPRLSVSP